VPDRSCPACHEPVAAHQTLCPSCRTPVPSEAGPVAADSSAFTFTAPPPRQRDLPAAPTWAPDPTAVAPTPAPAPAEPVIRSGGYPSDPITGSGNGGQGVPASAGTLGTPGAAVLDERGTLPGGIVGLLASALVVVGVFLPWIGVEGRDVSGWAASGDAKVLLGIAGIATVLAALLIGGARSLALRLTMVGLGVVALGLGAYEVASANGIDEFDVSLGIGLVVVLAGGAALAVSGALTRHRRFL
jgi:hypothetical protein